MKKAFTYIIYGVCVCVYIQYKCIHAGHVSTFSEQKPFCFSYVSYTVTVS